MPIEPAPDASAQAQQLYQLESSIEALNARIARLAIGLGVALDRTEELQRVMSLPPLAAQANERRSGAQPSQTSRTSGTVERRLSLLWEELRGLLVLRYSVETRCVQEVGVDATRELMTQAEVNLERNGFKPGADGIKLERLFKDAD